MKTELTSSRVILSSSIVVLLLFVIYFTYYYSHLEIPEFYTLEERRNEYEVILYHLPMIIPALLGFGLHESSFRRIIPAAYVLYMIVGLFCYSSILWSDDALKTGLAFMVFGIPYSLILSLVLLFGYLRKG